jgi:hypothetical protein
MQRIFIRSIFVLGAAAIGLSLMLALPAAAGTVHSWQTQEGTLAFTDDVKRIPARYRATVSSRELGGLGDYVRFSGADEKEKTLYAARVQARLNRLRNANGAVALALPSGEGEAAFLVRTSGGDNGVSTQVGFPLADAEEEPIVTNNVRMMPENSIATRHVTIVRQGDRILSVVKPSLNQYPGTFPSEADLP